MNTQSPLPNTKPRTVNPWTWQDQFGYSQALEMTAPQRVLYCAGQVSMDASGTPVHADDMGAQVRQAMENLVTVLQNADYSLANLVRLTVYTTDVDSLFAHYGAITDRLQEAGVQPPITLLGVTRLAFPELLVEIEATAAR